MSEQEYLEREQRIEANYRDGFLTLQEKKQALENLLKEWDEQ